MEITQTIAKNTRIFRAASGLNQDQLAERAGICPAYIGKIEAGRGNVTLTVLESLAAALGVAPAQLVSDIQFDQRAA